MMADAVSDVSVLAEARQEKEPVSPVSPVSPDSPDSFLSELVLSLADVVASSAVAAASVVVFAAVAGVAAVAVVADVGCCGGVTLTLATTVEYCCISITAASSKTCSGTLSSSQFTVILIYRERRTGRT